MENGFILRKKNKHFSREGAGAAEGDGGCLQVVRMICFPQALLQAAGRSFLW